MISKVKKYPLLDWFRMAAAILVVAIHTSPLSSLNESADFILTRIIARIAVPFFFLITGFFMGPEAEKRGWRCAVKFSKKIGMIYGFSILLYLPLNLYTGYFKEDFSAVKLVKDLFFNGTFYHMWYLPAAIIGMLLVSVLVKTVGVHIGLFITLILYAVGLMGDSYYGAAQQVPFLKLIYDKLFLVFDYTRNGLFMAPVFLMEGMWIRRRRFDKRNQKTDGSKTKRNYGSQGKAAKRLSWVALMAGLVICMALLITEGLWVHRNEWARHDSMYIALPFVMYFLFGLLLRFNRGQDRLIRAASLIVYLIHPWMIVAVRGAAKAVHMEELLIQQSLVHYLAVLAGSLVMAAVVCCISRGRKKSSVTVRQVDFSQITMKKADFSGARDDKDAAETGQISVIFQDNDREQRERNQEGERTKEPEILDRAAQGPDIYQDEAETGKRAWARVDLGAISHNCEVLKKLLPDSCGIMAIVKADGYGHGDIEVARELNQCGVNAFAVAAIEEGIGLRKAGIRGEILILGYTDPELADQLKRYDLCQTIVDNEYGLKLNAVGVNVKVYVGIDTGMHRVGILAEDVERIKDLYRHRYLKIQGMFSHLCVSDSLAEEDVAYTDEQITRFFRLVNHLQSEGVDTGKIHIQASFGIVNYPDLPCDYARPGLVLYGVLNGEGTGYEKRPDVWPALSLHARIGAIKEIQAGDSVSYGRTFKAAAPMKIAAVTIGYADGIPRNLSGSGGWVLVHGCKAPVLGRVCMDQMMIDISHIPDVESGDKVTLIGTDGTEQISCELFSEWCDTIPNEILTQLGTRVSRIYI
ncbi:MAG: serine racemase VanT catalytic subunit [Lachnospiraceae bacterium]|nr:serine racemase VanT catalytic subunit [Lachnospiraceae bacterium]